MAPSMLNSPSCLVPKASTNNLTFPISSTYKENSSHGYNTAVPDSMVYPKINIHYRSNIATSSSHIIQRSYPVSHSTSVVSYRICHNELNDTLHNSTNTKMRSSTYPVSHTGMGMGSKGIQTYNGMRGVMLNTDGDSIPGRCIKVHPRHNQTQLRMSARPYQVPIGSLAPQSKHRSKSFSMPYNSQQKLSTDFTYRQGMLMMENPAVSKFDSNHFVHHNPIGCRINNPSPLITSLSPFRTIKSNAQKSKSQGQHCQIVPSKSKIHYTSSSYHSDNTNYWKTGAGHAIPISTTLRPCGSVSSRSQTSLGHIKVCLPTHSLKIPIAKLRGGRKTAFVKGRMKSIHLSPSSLTQRSEAASHSCPQSHSTTGQNNPNVLAKVLSFQSGVDSECIKSSISSSSSVSQPSVRKPLCSPLVTNSKRNSALHITGGICVNDSGNNRPDSQMHLVSVRNNHSSSVSSAYSKIPVSGQKAVIINPLHIQRRPILPSMGHNSAIVKTSISFDKCSNNYQSYSDNISTAARCNKDIDLIHSYGICDNSFNEKSSCGESISGTMKNVHKLKRIQKGENCSSAKEQRRNSSIERISLTNSSFNTSFSSNSNLPDETIRVSTQASFKYEESTMQGNTHVQNKHSLDKTKTNKEGDTKEKGKENIITVFPHKQEGNIVNETNSISVLGSQADSFKCNENNCAIKSFPENVSRISSAKSQSLIKNIDVIGKRQREPNLLTKPFKNEQRVFTAIKTLV